MINDSQHLDDERLSNPRLVTGHVTRYGSRLVDRCGRSYYGKWFVFATHTTMVDMLETAEFDDFQSIDNAIHLDDHEDFCELLLPRLDDEDVVIFPLLQGRVTEPIEEVTSEYIIDTDEGQEREQEREEVEVEQGYEHYSDDNSQ